MTKVKLDAIYRPSDDVVARDIEGELIIVPLAAGIGDLEDELYTLNETAKDVWDRMLAGKRLREIIDELTAEYRSPAGEIEEDVLGLVEELLKRRIIVEEAG